MSTVKGIDVSYWNGAIDWRKVANQGIKFAIIRACYGWDNDKQIDSKLVANVAGCEANNIPYGFYHYSYAESVADAKKEAAFFLRVIKDYKPSYPVYFDFEEAFQVGGTKDGKTYQGYTPEKQLQIIEAFLGEIEKAGYFGGLYMSASALQRLYNYAPARVKRFAVWVAHINKDKPSYSGAYGMWQYSWVGKVNGSSADTDMNWCYVDYPEIIKRVGLNGWNKATDKEETPQESETTEKEQTVPLSEYNALKAKYDALIADIESLTKKYGG